MTNLEYRKGKGSLSRDLSQVFQSNKSVTGRINYLNRQTEKSIKRMKDLLQVQTV